MKPAIRVGIGFDFHPFTEGRELFLGGVGIPHQRGLGGHSDADVLLHAVIDALLGAVGLGDIGTHFPDTDPQYEGVSSLSLLEHAVGLVQKKAWAVGNVDAIVVAEEPQIAPHRDAIRSTLCRVLQISPDEINIKATTMEGKGPIGRKEGIAAQAVILLHRTVVAS